MSSSRKFATLRLVKHLKYYIIAGAVLSVVGFVGCVYALFSLYDLVGGTCTDGTKGCQAFTNLRVVYSTSQALVISGAVIVLVGLILLHIQKDPKKHTPRK